MINWLVICSLCFLYSLFVSVLKVNPIPNYVTYFNFPRKLLYVFNRIGNNWQYKTNNYLINDSYVFPLC